MKFAAETSAGRLELEVTQPSGGMLVYLTSTGDTWNSTYTPVPLSSFLVEFAGLPDAEAQELSARVLDDWEASGESSGPSLRSEAPKVAATALPVLTLIVLTLVTFGLIVYVVLKMLLGW